MNEIRNSYKYSFNVITIITMYFLAIELIKTLIFSMQNTLIFFNLVLNKYLYKSLNAKFTLFSIACKTFVILCNQVNSNIYADCFR